MIFVPFLAVKYNCDYMFVRAKILQLVSFLCVILKHFQKKIQAREKEVYGRKAKEKEIEKRQENKIKKY